MVLKNSLKATQSFPRNPLSHAVARRPLKSKYSSANKGEVEK